MKNKPLFLLGTDPSLRDFAATYLEHALKTDSVALENPEKAKGFRDKLLSQSDKLRGQGSPDRISLREALEAWRATAERLVTPP